MNEQRDWLVIALVSLGAPLALLLVFIILALSSSAAGAGCMVQAYQDLDCNGRFDWASDLPLAGACAWSGWRPWPPAADYCAAPQHQTDGQGVWLTAGSRSRFVVVRPPEGYEPTSDTIGECPPRGLSGRLPSFGFAPAGMCPPRDIVTAEAYYRQRVAGYLVGGVVVAALVGGLALFLRRARAATRS